MYHALSKVNDMNSTELPPIFNDISRKSFYHQDIQTNQWAHRDRPPGRHGAGAPRPSGTPRVSSFPGNEYPRGSVDIRGRVVTGPRLSKERKLEELLFELFWIDLGTILYT